jgi:hypothetical protein
MSKRRKRPSGDPRKRPAPKPAPVSWSVISGGLHYEPVTEDDAWRQDEFGDEIAKGLDALLAVHPRCEVCGANWRVNASGPYVSSGDPDRMVEFQVFCSANLQAELEERQLVHEGENDLDAGQFMVSLSDLSVDQVWYD